MQHDIKRQISELEALDTNALKKLWVRYFSMPPQRIRRDYLAANLAYKIQEKKYGGLSKTIKNKLKRLAFGDQQKLVPKYSLSPGTKLVREWGGKKHVVSVTDKGFEYEGKIFRSLTKIVKEMTGYVHSGPIFFGLKPGTKEK